MVNEPLAIVDDTHPIAIANGALMVKPKVSFLTLVANFGETLKLLKNIQKIRLVQLYSNRIVLTNLNVADTLSIALEPMDKTAQQQKSVAVNNAAQIIDAD